MPINDYFKTGNTNNKSSGAKPAVSGSSGGINSYFKTGSSQIIKSTTPTPTPVVIEQPKNIFQKIGSGIKSFYESFVPPTMTVDGITAPIAKPIKPGQSMEFRITGSNIKPEDLTTQSNTLNDTAELLHTQIKTLDKTNPQAVSDYNTKLTELKTGVEKYNKDLADYNVSQEFNYNTGKDARLAEEIISKDPTQTGFLGALKSTFIPTQFINAGDSGLLNTAREKVNMQYQTDHPVLSVLAQGLGQIANLVLIGKMGGGFNLSGVTGKVISPGISNLFPTLTRMVGLGAESASIFGIESFIAEGLRQKGQQDFSAGKLTKETAKGAGTGLALGVAGSFAKLPTRIIAGGVTMGGLTTLETYLSNGTITSKDFVNIAVNTIVGAGFEAFGGRNKSDLFRAKEMNSIARESTISKMTSGMPSMSQVEAEALANNYGLNPTEKADFIARRMKGRPGMPRAEAEKLSSLINELNYIVKSGIYQKMPAQYEEAFKNLPVDFNSGSRKLKYDYFNHVADQVANGKTIAQAIDIVNAMPVVPSNPTNLFSTFNDLKTKLDTPDLTIDPAVVEQYAQTKAVLDSYISSKKETVVSIPGSDKNVPAVEISVVNMGKNKWAYSFNITTPQVSFMSDFTTNPAQNSRKLAIDTAKKQLTDWVMEKITQSEGTEKAQLQTIVSEIGNEYRATETMQETTKTMQEKPNEPIPEDEMSPEVEAKAQEEWDNNPQYGEKVGELADQVSILEKKLKETKGKIEQGGIQKQIDKLNNQINNINESFATKWQEIAKQRKDVLSGEAFKVETKKEKKPRFVKTKLNTKKIEKLETELKNAYKKYPDTEKELSQILTQLELAEAGSRLFDYSGIGTEVTGIPSTFPVWIPDQARTKKSLDALREVIKDVSTITYPSKSNATTKRLLVNEMLSVLDDRLGIDTSKIRNDIMKEYGQDQKVNPSNVEGGQLGGRGSTTANRAKIKDKQIEDLQDEIDRLKDEINTGSGFSGKLSVEDIASKKVLLSEKENQIIEDYVDSKKTKFRIADTMALVVPENKKLTSRFLEHIDVRDKEFASYSYLYNLSKSTGFGLKAEEREIVQDVLNNLYKDNPKINMTDFRNIVIGNMLPIDMIESDTYATYGADNVGLNGLQSKTYILNSPFEHGHTGHFSQDFETTIPESELEIKEIPVQEQNPRAKFAVIKKGVVLTEQNIEENVFTVATTVEEAQKWIDNHVASGDKEGRQINVVVKGLFGHFRTFDIEADETIGQKQISHIAEMQSDTFQRGNLEVTNRDYNQKEKEIARFIVEKARLEKIQATRITTQAEPDSAYGSVEALKASPMYIATQEEIEILNDRRIKVANELLKLKPKPLPQMEKAFLGYEGIWQERIVREAIHQKAKEGFKLLRFPTPRTVAVIEGYTGGDEYGEGTMPYEIISGDRDGLNYGDTIEYGGEEMTVVDVQHGEITVAPSKEVTHFDAEQAMDEDIQGRWDNDVLYYFKALEKDFGTINTAEKAQAVLDKVAIYDQAVNFKNIKKDIEQEKHYLKTKLSAKESGLNKTLQDETTTVEQYTKLQKLLKAGIIKKAKLTYNNLNDTGFKNKLEKKYGLDYSFWNYFYDAYSDVYPTDEKMSESKVKKYVQAKIDVDLGNAKDAVKRVQENIKSAEKDTAIKIEGIGERTAPTPVEIATLPKAVQKDLTERLASEYNGSGYGNMEYDVQNILENMVDKTEGFDIYDFEDRFKQDMAENYDNDFAGMYGEDKVFYEDKGYNNQEVWVVENGTENFSQPDQYEEASTIEDFNIENFTGSQKTVLLFYEKQVNKYLAKIRKDNLDLVVDDNGYEWLQTQVIPADLQAPTAYRLKDNLANVGIDITDTQEKKIKDLNKKIFGDADVKVVGQILANKDALGSYKAGIINILKGQADAKDTFYHETVHKYLDILTERNEYIEILKEAKVKYNSNNLGMVEEKLAEGIINYAKTREGFTGRLKLLIDKFLLRIKAYLGSESKIDQLYLDIISGKAAKIKRNVIPAPAPPTRRVPSGEASAGAQSIDTFEELPTTPTKEDTKIFEKVKTLIEKYAKSIGEDYTPRGALGVYYGGTTNIRIKGMNDLSVAAHEITHFLDHSYDISDQLMGVKGTSISGNPIYESSTAKIRKEMTKLYEQYYPGGKANHKLRKRMLEGFATLLQKYTEQPSTITALYPNLVKDFLTSEGKYYKPIMGEIIRDLREIISEYQGLSALDKIGARVINNKVNVNKDSFLNFWQKFKTEVADNIYPIEVLAKKAGVHFTKADPSLWVRQYNSSNAIINNNLTGKRGFWGWRNGELSKLHDFNWKDIIKDLHKTKMTDTFGYWLVARREYFAYQELKVLEIKLKTLAKSVVDAGGAEEASKLISANGQSLLSEYKDMQRVFQEAKDILTNDGFSEKEVNEAYFANKDLFIEAEKKFDILTKEDLNFLNDPSVGLLNKDEYNQLTSKEGYASFKRYFYDELVGEVDVGVGRVRFGSAKVSSLLKRTGSQKPIINPLMSALKNHAEATRKGLKQTIYNKMAMLAINNPDLGLFQRLQVQAVPDGQGRMIFPQEKDPNIIMGRLDYKRVPILTDTTIKQTIDEVLNFQNINMFENLLLAGSRFFTKGTTGLFPGFALTNYTIDQVTAVAQTRNNYMPVYDPLHTIAMMLNPNKPDHVFLQEYMVMGGERQTMVGWQDMSPNELFTAVAHERTGLLKVIDAMNSGMNVLALPSQWSEIMTRATEYIKSREAGKTPIVALEEAGRVTAPFHHIGRLGGGRFGKTAIKSIPFFNPGIQVLAQVGETLGRDPESRRRYLFVMLAVIAASVGAMGLTLAKGTDQQKQLYADINPDELNKYIFLPNPNGTSLIKIRIPDQMEFIATMINMMWADKELNAKFTVGEYLNAGTSWLPAQFDFTQPTKMFMAWIPQLIKPGVLTLAGVKDFPKIQPLVSQTLQNRAPEFQYNQSTSPVAIWLGSKLGLSPIKIDYLLTGYVGRASGFLTGKPGIYNPLSSLNRDYYFTSGRKIQSFYDLKQTNDENYDAYKNKRKTFGLGERSAIIKLRSKLDNITTLIGYYRDVDEVKNPEKAKSLQGKILKAIDNL